MDNDEIRILLAKYRKGTLSAEERAILESWYLSVVKDNPGSISDGELQKNLRIVEDLVISNTKPLGTGKRRFRMVAALLFIGGLAWLFFALEKKKPSLAGDRMAYIAPGSNKATLRLVSGRRINLNGDKEGIVVKKDGLSYNDGSQVEGTKSLRDLKGQGQEEDPGRDYFELSTPKGGQYQILLPDGSKVWLNAASVLRYPAKFDKNKREVTLEGEAYFEVVSHQSSGNGPGTAQKLPPFVVESNGVKTMVLGTSFNISAYKEDMHTATTLVEGKVKVTSRVGKEINEVMLKPGQETIRSGKGFETREADIPSVLGWKEGVFKFSDSELRTIMLQLSRWYNIDVEYRGIIPETYFYGVIRRDKPLNEVLDILKEGGVNFNVQSAGGRKKLLVLPAPL